MIPHYMCYRKPHISFTESLSSEKTNKPNNYKTPQKHKKTQTNKPKQNQNPNKLPW